jgi:hypothetical protein
MGYETTYLFHYLPYPGCQHVRRLLAQHGADFCNLGGIVPDRSFGGLHERRGSGMSNKEMHKAIFFWFREQGFAVSDAYDFAEAALAELERRNG